MATIDLTHEVVEGMPVYPGDPSPTLEPTARSAIDGYNAFKLCLGSHAGTHIDAPSHMIDGAAGIAEIDPERLIGRGVLVDARGLPQVDADLLGRTGPGPGDIVLVWTGWSERFGGADYFDRFPIVTDACAAALVDIGVSALGLDTPSPDRAPFTAHRILLSAGVPIIENLVGMSRLDGIGAFRVLALPLRLRADASPARVVALTGETERRSRS